MREAWFKCGASIVSNTKAFRQKGMTFHKRKKAHAASPALEKRQQVLEAPSGA